MVRKESKRMSHGDVLEKNVSGRENRKCKSPEAKVFQHVQKATRWARVTEEE